MKLSWYKSFSTPNDISEIDIKSVEELDSTLDNLQEKYREQPTCATLDSKDGQGLLFGLGRDISMVGYNQSADGPYFTSLGDINNKEIVTFFYNEPTEFEGKSLIPMGLVRKAIREFFNTKKRPSSITWQEA